MMNMFQILSTLLVYIEMWTEHTKKHKLNGLINDALGRSHDS